jgi:nucleotide-binding universal stress UspA family protein
LASECLDRRRSAVPWDSWPYSGPLAGDSVGVTAVAADRRCLMNPTKDIVVVGVDGSPGGRRALEWAMAEAARRDAALQVVTAWTWDVPYDTPSGAASRAEERARLDEQIQAQVREVAEAMEHPPVISVELVEGRPVDALAHAARSAALLVLGSHGHSRLRTALVGSVTEDCVRHVDCPLVIIPVPHPFEPLEAEAVVPAQAR